MSDIKNIATTHIELNEDGRYQKHSGYILTECKDCGRPNLHSRLRPVPVCIGAHKESDAPTG